MSHIKRFYVERHITYNNVIGRFSRSGCASMTVTFVRVVPPRVEEARGSRDAVSKRAKPLCYQAHLQGILGEDTLWFVCLLTIPSCCS
jgi:hypothetical protein